MNFTSRIFNIIEFLEFARSGPTHSNAAGTNFNKRSRERLNFVPQAANRLGFVLNFWDGSRRKRTNAREMANDREIGNCAGSKLLIAVGNCATGRKMNRFGTSMKSLSAAVCCILAGQLIVPSAPAQTMPKQLNIVIVKGDGAVHDARQHLTTPPTVRVEDENQKPVVNAAVVFTLPTEGATGEFGNNSKTLTVLTDGEGLATARGMRTNLLPGKIPIHINASYRGLIADTSMTQMNVVGEGARRGHGGRIAVILLIVAAAAGGGAYAAMRNSKSKTPTGTVAGGTSPIGITAGTGAVGAPH